MEIEVEDKENTPKYIKHAGVYLRRIMEALDSVY